MGQVTESDGYLYTYDLNGNLTSLKSPEGAEIKYIYDDADRLIRTEEKVQADTLTLQENAVCIVPSEEGWEQEDGKGTLYPENSFVCNVVLHAGYGVKGETSLSGIRMSCLPWITAMQWNTVFR